MEGREKSTKDSADEGKGGESDVLRLVDGGRSSYVSLVEPDKVDTFYTYGGVDDGGHSQRERKKRCASPSACRGDNTRSLPGFYSDTGGGSGYDW